MVENQSQLLKLVIHDDNAGSPDQLERVTLQLRRSIGELPVESVDRVTRPGQPGEKTLDPAIVGELAVKLLPSVVPLLCDLLRKWVNHSSTRRFTVVVGGKTVEISGELTSEQSAALVKAIVKERK